MNPAVNVRDVIGRVAHSGLPDTDDIEIRRKVFLVNLFCTVGCLFLFFFGLNNLLSDRMILAVVTLSCAGIALGNFLFLRYSGNYRRAGDVVVLIMLAVFVYLICSGGVDNTGPLWCYSAVPIILFLYGTVRGLSVIAVLTLFTALVMLTPDMPLRQTEYTLNFSLRFLASFAAVVIMSGVYEYARDQSHRQIHELHEISNQEARTDSLTGLPNRRYMYESIGEVCLRQAPDDGDAALLLCDLDRFKQINDTYGHRCGDDVLVEVARILKATLRGDDIACRWGGEEFLIALPRTGREGAMKVADTIRGRIESLNIACDGESLRPTVSIGVHVYRRDWPLGQNLAQADQNLYHAKELGRNRVCAGETGADPCHPQTGSTTNAGHPAAVRDFSITR